MAWAIGGALRLAIGAGVIALVLATTLTGEAGERLATTAYLAAIFAAVALIAQRFLPAPDEARSAGAPAFPVFLTYFTAIAVVLTIAAALVSEPLAELLFFVACASLVVLAVLARTGALATFNAALQRGGFLVAATRYAVAAGVVTLVIAAIVPADWADGAASFAYRIALGATLFVAASLVAPTRFGIWIARSCVRGVNRLDSLAQALVFARLKTYAAVVAIAFAVMASLLPGAFGEPFAFGAYAAACAAVIGVAMECRRLRS